MGLKILLAATMAWPATARIAGGLSRFGCQIDALCPLEAPIRESRYINLRHAYRAISPLTSLRDALSISKPDLVIPADDRAVQLLLRLRELEPQSPNVALITRSLGAPDNFARMMARGDFAADARDMGIAVPETFALENEAELDAALDAIGLPAVIKADGSWGGDGVAIARTRDEAHAAYRRLSQPVSPLRSLARAVLRSDAHHLHAAAKPKASAITVQSFIPGNPATTAFACWQGDVMATLHMDVVAANGATGPASVVRRMDCPQMESAARAIARRYNLSGLHGLDFIRNAQGKAHLLEINPRATQTSYLAFGAGRDLLAGLVERASGQRCPARPVATTNHLVALFPQEWSRDAASPYLKSAFHDIPWDDPDLLRAWLAFAPLRKARKKNPAPIARSRVYGMETIAN